MAGKPEVSYFNNEFLFLKVYFFPWDINLRVSVRQVYQNIGKFQISVYNVVLVNVI